MSGGEGDRRWDNTGGDGERLSGGSKDFIRFRARSSA